MTGGEETRVLEAVAERAFAVVKDGIYFFALGPSSKTLVQFHRFATNQTITLGTIEKPVTIYLDASADGRWLLYSQEDRRVDDVMLVETSADLSPRGGRAGAGPSARPRCGVFSALGGDD